MSTGATDLELSVLCLYDCRSSSSCASSLLKMLQRTNDLSLDASITDVQCSHRSRSRSSLMVASLVTSRHDQPTSQARATATAQTSAPVDLTPVSISRSSSRGPDHASQLVEESEWRCLSVTKVMVAETYRSRSDPLYCTIYNSCCHGCSIVPTRHIVCTRF
jgi:hypothetical protein